MYNEIIVTILIFVVVWADSGAGIGIFVFITQYWVILIVHARDRRVQLAMHENLGPRIDDRFVEGQDGKY